MADFLLAYFQKNIAKISLFIIIYAFFNIICILSLRIRQLKSKLMHPCCAPPVNAQDLMEESVDKQVDEPIDESMEENAISEGTDDCVTARLESSTSDPNFNAMVSTSNDGGQNETDQEMQIEEWRRGIERIVRVKRMVDSKAEELAEDMSFSPGRELNSFFSSLADIAKEGAETKQSVKEVEVVKPHLEKKSSVKVYAKEVEVVKPKFEKTPSMKMSVKEVPFMEELKQTLLKRQSKSSSMNSTPDKLKELEADYNVV